MADNTEYTDGGEGTTIVIGPISPTHPLDDYPTAFSKHISGGFMHLDTIAERDAIKALRREVGQVVYVTETNAFYRLNNGIENINWEEVFLDIDGGIW